MAMTLEEITKHARELSPEEQEILILELTEGLSPENQKRIDQAWSKEIQRRHAARLAGDIKSRPLNEVINDITSGSHAKS